MERSKKIFISIDPTGKTNEIALFVIIVYEI